ncbi:hypothetical protein CGZ95_11495 [Enemella evansiae]|uniref:T6SS immunity protein Tdi1 domain-containing protein n=1 Tax=Enemella evansiae TaxID=2016499 RepID=UPI000B96BFC9|nr:T6SS immunity protein Tdi1 domain-containing protein [Enemella evansiae]OYN99525.1 hypothetical protein CGZ95_11495 [Enemella evansiae]
MIPSSLESVAQDGPYFPWLRTAFGEMYCWSPTHGAALNISPVFRQVGGYDYTRDIADGLPDTGLEEVLLADRDEFDMRAEDGKPLFRRLLKKLGPVGPDTMYALTPAAVAGGPVIEKNFSIEPAEAQLAVLASL